MNIFLKFDNSVIANEFDPYDDIGKISEFICNKLDIDRKHFWLCYGGKILFDKKIIREILKKDSTLDINFRPFDTCKIISKSNVYFIDLNMLLLFSDFNFSFDYNDDQYVIYLKDELLDDKLLKIWYDFYKKFPTDVFNFIKKNTNKTRLFYKIPLEILQFLNVIEMKYIFKFLGLCEYLNISSYYNLLCCYIAKRFFENIDEDDLDLFVNNYILKKIEI
mgnify:CR=1 FL=1|jgi:hypothetical protein